MANLHLLFWLSLLPFTTGWMGENHFAALAAALYGCVLLAAAIAYWMLQQCIISAQDPESPLRRAPESVLGQLVYCAVALLWLVADRRIERQLHHHA